MSLPINPYETPMPIVAPERRSVLPTRRELKSLIDAFLDRRISQIEFYESLAPYLVSKDPVIEMVCLFFDEEHPPEVFENQRCWKLLQRHLLALQPETRVIDRRNCVAPNRIRQSLAAIGLVLLGTCVWNFGFNAWLLIGSGLISMALSFAFPARSTDPYAEIILPFASFADLERAYRISGFRKRKFPDGKRQSAMEYWRRGNAIGVAVVSLPFLLIWMAVSPLVLLMQALPFQWSERRVVFPAQPSVTSES